MPTYEMTKDFYGQEFLKRTDEDGKIWFIPKDEANSDYQAYLNKDKQQSELTKEAPAKK